MLDTLARRLREALAILATGRPAALRLEAAGRVGVGVNVEIVARDARTGVRLWAIERHNIVTDTGLTAIARRLSGAPDGGSVSAFALGHGGSTPEHAAQTGLVAETFRDQVTKRTVTDRQLLVQYYLPSTVANGAVFDEAGLFAGLDADAAMYARTTFPAFTKSSALTVTFSWTFTFARAEEA